MVAQLIKMYDFPPPNILSTVSKKHIKDAEYIIAEQADIIAEYHNNMKALVDRNQALQKEAEYFKKEYQHGKGQSDVHNQSVEVTNDYSGKPNYHLIKYF
jgi:hypothetical protein